MLRCRDLTACLSHDNLVDETGMFAVGRQPRYVQASQVPLQSLHKAHKIVYSKDVIFHEASQVGWGFQHTVEGVTNYICPHWSKQIQGVVDKAHMTRYLWRRWGY